LTALTVVVPPSVPPAPEKIATVTGAVELLTVLPDPSRTATTGGVVKSAPDGPGTGGVVIIRIDPKLTEFMPGDVNRSA
jgi:hypothetical protein